ncbi:MAG TPA: class I SAM-dependent methyltransferase, partial [Candidatus Elarobacter sp.]|nr:class I SAM-dependent methyltransferase [Candidatus Elarobacter sp.]
MPLGSYLRGAVGRLYAESERLNVENMRAQIALAEAPREVVDLGCGDGRVTLDLVAGLNGAHVRGVEGFASLHETAVARGLEVVTADLEQRLPIDDGSIDVVVSNQVIEHLADTDAFVAEIHRLLRPGGIAVVSTENMASWHNVAALVLGFQAFSASNYSNRRYPLGNPLGLHAGENATIADGMLHRRIFTTRALRELFRAHDFEVLGVRGSGYHPLPPRVGRL